MSDAHTLFVFFLLVGAVVSSDDSVFLSTNAVVKTGVPFHIVGIVRSPEHFKLNFTSPDGAAVTLEPPDFTFNTTSAFDPVVKACPQEKPFGDITAHVYNSTHLVSKLKIGLEDGAQLEKGLQLVREGGKIKGVLRIKTVIFEAPIYDLSCSFKSSTTMELDAYLNRTVYRLDKPLTQPTQPLQCTADQCPLGEMVGHTELLLEVFFADPASTIFSLDVSCGATFGLMQCASVFTANDTLHPGVIFQVPPTVIAGNNLTLKVSGVEDIQDCTITLPNAKDYHLAGSVSGCTQSSQNITCHVNKSVEVPVHVDSSASKADKSDFHLKCEKIKTVQQGTVKVDVSSAVGSVDFGGFLRVLKPARFNVSIIVTNAGPSDLKDLQCDFSYEDDVGALSHPDGDCTFDNHTGIYTCPIKIGTVPGLDAKGKAGKVNHTVTFEHVPEVVWAISSLFSVKCPGNKEIHRNFKVNDTDFMVIGKPPVDSTMQNDGYFWTYAIVIVNLFVIALVVFVGMWWRNRAIAKTMEGRGGAGGFTEMELFSEGGGRLPMSKAD